MPRRTRSPPHFEHTLVDLEDRVNKSIIDVSHPVMSPLVDVDVSL